MNPVPPNQTPQSTSSNWFVYIVECADSSLYTGIATDVARRVQEHNAGTGAKYTRARSPVELRYSESHPNRSSASQREHQLKQLTRRQKLKLIASGQSHPL